PRLVDKRKIRRDLADVFSTLAEGLKARRAKEWGFIDGSFPRSRFDEEIAKRAAELAKRPSPKDGAKGIALAPITPKVSDGDTVLVEYRYVTLRCDRAKRLAELTVTTPDGAHPKSVGAIHEAGSDFWALRAFRELDDAICRLRFDEEETGLVLLRTRGDARAILEIDRMLAANRGDWFVNEIVLHMARVLRRLDVTAKSLFAIVDGESCFAGSLLELALAADRIYMKNDPA